MRLNCDCETISIFFFALSGQQNNLPDDRGQFLGGGANEAR